MDANAPAFSGICTGPLLSPPISPQMSGCTVTSGESNWHTGWATTRSHSPFIAEIQGPVILGLDAGREPAVRTEGRSLARPQGYAHPRERAENWMNAPQDLRSPVQRRTVAQGQPISQDAQGQAKTHGEERFHGQDFERLTRTGSFPRFIPDIKVANEEEETDYEDEEPMTASDLDENGVERETVKTHAEARAEKRKMKRFRLTHSQTRFLQSEFARQAHPDAAQRERLSREIPGLSPRQVQVWFQNRRAKLKRLTSDDRERIMKSRALPVNFDTTQALHSTLARPLGYVGVPSNAYSPVSINDEEARSHGFKHEPDDHIPSPESMGSAFNPIQPDSFSGSEITSPASLSQDLALIPGSSTPKITGLRPTNPFSRSQSFPTIYQAQPRSPKPQPHVQATKRRADSLASPLGSNPPVVEQIGDHRSPPTSETDRSLFASQVHQRYAHASDVGSFREKDHHPSVQNIFAPSLNYNLPDEGQWHGFPDSTLTHIHSDRLESSSDLGMASQHWPLTDRRNLEQAQAQGELQNSSAPPLDDYGLLLQQSRMLYQTQAFDPSSFVDLRPQVPQFYQTPAAPGTIAEASSSVYLSGQASTSPDQYSSSTSR